MREFVDLKSIYADNHLDSENYSVYYSYTSEEELKELKEINYAKPWYTNGLKADTPYVTLFKNGHKVMMSDVPMEKETNQHFIDSANGNVLICGLGLGLIIFPLLQDQAITNITVIELDSGLIEMVGPIIKQHDHFCKLNIIEGDAFSKNDLIGEKIFDTIYFDIWISIMADNFREMKMLHSMYHSNLNTANPNCFIDSWCYDYCKKLEWQTSELIEFLKKEHPDKTIDIEREVLFINGEPMNHVTINDALLNSKHRFS